jgi:hypothetical protein
MSLHSQFKVDKAKETEGVEIQYGPNADGSIPTFRVLRRSPTNQKYAKTLERESAPYRRLLELGTLDKQVEERIMRRTFCLSVLVDWKNVQNDKNEEIPYSFDNAMKLFEELPELYYDLADQSSKLSSFRAESKDGDAKN